MFSSASNPTAREIARSIFSFGILALRATSTARRKRKFWLGSPIPPPCFTAIVIALESLVNVAPRLISVAAFCLLIVAHLECPLMHVFYSDSLTFATKHSTLFQSKLLNMTPQKNQAIQTAL